METRPNRQIANGVHPTQAETLVPPPFVFPDGTTFKASSDTQRKILETIFKAKQVYLNAKKTDPNVREADYILSKPELCRKIYPGVPFRVASNDLDVTFKALRNDMYKQAVPWQLITVTPKLGKPSTYDIKKVPQSIPVEPKNGEQTTQPPPPPQLNTNGKTPESQSRVERGPTEKRPFTNRDLVKLCDRNPNAVQDKTSGIRKKKPGFGILIGGVWHYSQEEVEWVIEEFKKSSSLSLKDIQYAKKKEQAGEKAEQRGRGEARIDQAKQLDQISADFTDAILHHLTISSPYTNPLDSLDRDLSLSSFLIYSSNGSRRSIEELKEKYTVKQVEISILISFIKILDELANSRNITQKEPEIKTRLRISNAQTVIDRYREPIDEDKKESLVQRTEKAIENVTTAIAEHFFVPLSRKQIVAILHLLRSRNT